MSAVADKILRRATFFYPCRGVELIGGTPYMMDAGPHGLHAAMSNFVAPAYGVVTLPNGRPGIRFNGANQYASLPLRFYDHAPTETFTFVTQIRHESPATNDYIFFAPAPTLTGARWRYYTIAGADGRMTIDWYGAAGTFNLAYETANRGMTPRTSVMTHGVDVASLSQLSMTDWGRTANAFSIAGGGPVVWDPTFAPTLMARVGIQYTGGTLAGFGLWPWLFTDREAKNITNMLVDGVL